jgi:calcineurin-binding protein cabin-1
MNIQVYLDSHRRKIQVLTVAAGMVGSVTPSKEKGSSNMDFVEAMNRNRLENVVEAVKDVSRNASKAKDFIDQCDNSVSWTSHFPLISFITHLTQIFSL